jgi:septum formation protein
MELILASGSPRRKEILKNMGFSFRVVLPEGEEAIDEAQGFVQTAKHLARQKAREVSRKIFPGDFAILSADTVVSLEGEILGKPKDEAQAKKMLLSLSGKTHEVCTGFCVLTKSEEIVESAVTKVTFKSLSEGEIESYVETKEPMDKAGAYGVQGLGALFVEGIEGDFFNVMGLPIARVADVLKPRAGIFVL